LAAYSQATWPNPEPSLQFNVGALGNGLGWLATSMGLAGLVLLAARSRDRHHLAIGLAMLVFSVAYLLLASVAPRHYARNMLPVLPFLAIGAGVVVANGTDWLRTRIRQRFTNRKAMRVVAARGAVILGALLLVEPVVSTSLDTQAVVLKDTRTAAREWILGAIPAGTAIARERWTPQFDPSEFKPITRLRLADMTLAWYEAEGVEYLVTSSFTYDQYVGNPDNPRASAFYRGLFELEEVYVVTANSLWVGPTIRIYRLR
jgi:hypothetical protein